MRATSDEAGGRNELARLLVLDNLVFATDGEARWLDHVEVRLALARARARTALRRLCGLGEVHGP